MEKTMNKALLIIGNGFDLNCGLKSSYKDFFDYQLEHHMRFKKLFEYLKDNHEDSFSENNIDEIIPLLYIEEDLSFFDIYFLVNDWKEGCLLTNQIWSAIEDVLLSGINRSQNAIIFDIIYNVYLSIGKKNYNLLYQYLYSHKIVAYYLKTIFNSDKISENQFREFLIKELDRFSCNFAKFINEQATNNDDYVEKAQTLLLKITGSALNECKIISFNYTNPFSTLESANIHGLASKNEIVFGITCEQGNGKKSCHHNWGYKMSKEYKMALIMSKGQKVSLDYDDVKDIYVYGLSLGEQDYDFFENLFDKFDFLMRLYEARIHFCYSVYGNKTIDEVAEETTQRVAKLINRFGDSHKNYGLLRSMIQRGSLDIRLIK